MGSVAASGGYWSRRRQTSSMPSRRPSPDRSACSASCRASKALAKLGLGADGGRRRRCRANRTCSTAPRPRRTSFSRLCRNDLRALPRYRRAIPQEDPQQIDQIAQGRVWDGGTARQLGLRTASEAGRGDRQGGGARQARRRARRTYLERPLSFREQLLDMLAQQERDEGATPTDGFAFIANGEVKLAQAMAELRSVLTGPNIQVRCLECPGPLPRGSSARTSLSPPSASGCSDGSRAD